MDSFLSERMPVLAEFVELLKLPDPLLVLVEAEKYLPAIDQWLGPQEVTPADHHWLCVRIGYFVGEYLVQKFGGCWFLDEIPDSRYFGHYVVGQFTRCANHRAMVDPLLVAEVCISEPAGRSLVAIIQEVQKELGAGV